MKDSGMEWVGEIPSSWNVVRTKSIFKQRSERGNDSPILLSATQAKGMIPQEMLESVVRVKINTDLQTFKSVHKGDYVISLRSFQGGFEHSEYEGVCSPAYQVFYPLVDIDSMYFKYLFKSEAFISKIDSLTIGIREGKNILFDDFADMMLMFPSLKEQELIVKYLNIECTKIDLMISLQEEMISELQAYKQSVINEAVMKGLDPDVLMKDSGVEWIGYIPEDANVVTVARLYGSKLGKMVCDKPSNDNDTLEPYLCAINVHFDGIDLSTLKEMWFSIDEKQKYILKNGDLLVVEGGAGSGGAAIVEIADKKDLYIQNSIHLVRANEGIALNKYLYYTLYSLVKRSYIDFVCNKATIPHFTKEKLMATPIVFFSIKIQQEIIDYLDTKCQNIDEMISLKQSKIDTLKEYKKSLIYECVTGKRDCTMGRQEDGA